ncbi:PucR family transcriptional regulator [Emergencia timonensis]|uniref:PucR family transcriptional regulator n=1 Tax=Emergencia timonensis TaxID=1776384 RepID=UPI00241F463B|nr:PucR family transcriptional regulator [Emergencia timonensis]
MKDITVLDILNLPIMANAELKAGQSGLSNIVSYVNVLDNYYDETDPESTPVNYGQNFYLTSMYYGVGNALYVDSLMQHFVDLKVSAVCITDEYLSALPSSAYEIADKNQVPVIFIDKNTPYALIISSIMELKLSYQESELHENLLHEMMLPHCYEDRKQEIIGQLNPNFHNRVTAFFCMNTDLSNNKAAEISNGLHLLNKIRTYKTSFACQYKNGMIIVRSYNTSKMAIQTDLTEDTIQFIRRMLPNAIIGISDSLPLTHLDEAIAQCSTASLSGAHDINGIVYYRDVGISKLLMKLISHPDLEEYYRSLIKPINEYDKKYKSELLATIKCFVECSLDHVKTGKQLHIHENTVRYRLNKIKELIPYGKSSLDFNQSIYFLYKILKIKELV